MWLSSFFGVGFCCGWVIVRVSALSVVAGSSVVSGSVTKPSVLWEIVVQRRRSLDFILVDTSTSHLSLVVDASEWADCAALSVEWAGLRSGNVFGLFFSRFGLSFLGFHFWALFYLIGSLASTVSNSNFWALLAGPV